MVALKNIFSILFCIVILSQAQAVEPSTKTDVQIEKVSSNIEASEISHFEELLSKPVTVNIDRSPDSNWLTVEYAVSTICKAVGVPYQGEKTATPAKVQLPRYTDAIHIKDIPARKALEDILKPFLLTYGLDSNGLYVYPSDIMVEPGERAKLVRDLFASYTTDGASLPIAYSSNPPFQRVPRFYWSDIPILLELAVDKTSTSMPQLSISSYIPREGGPKGLIALWLIEGLRRKQVALAWQSATGEEAMPRLHYHLPIVCLPRIKGASWPPKSEDLTEIHPKILDAYRNWWQTVATKPSQQAALSDPLADKNISWGREPWYNTADVKKLIDQQAKRNLKTAQKKADELQKRSESLEKLRRIGTVLFLYSVDHDDKYPDTLEALKPYGIVEELAWAVENIEYLGGKVKLTDRAEAIVAYDKTMLVQEDSQGTIVLYNDSHVSFEKTEQLKKLGIKSQREHAVRVERQEDWGEAVCGLRCRIEPSRKRFLVDNPISFRITFENTGEKTIHLRGVGQSRIYEAGDFYFNDQKVESMPFIHLDSMKRSSVTINPNQSKVVLFTLSQWGMKDHKIPQTPGQYNVRFHYAGAMISDSDKSDDGFISQNLGEVVSNTVQIEIAEQPDPARPEVEIESLKEILEKLREAIGNNCYIFDTVIRGAVSEESEKYHFMLIHNPRTSKQGRKEAAEIVKWSLGGLVVAENDEYFLLVSEQSEEVEKQEELIAKICALLSLEANKIRRDMEHYLIEETRLVAREMGGQMVLTLHPGIILKEIGGWAQEFSMEDLQKFMQKYPEERNWHAHMHGIVATFLRKKDRWGEALDTYQKMIDEYGELVLPMFPGRILAKDQAQLGMADCYRQMGATEIALEILDNLKSQTTSRMIRRTAEKEYAELYNEVFKQSK